ALDTTRLAVTKNQHLKLLVKEDHQAEQGNLYLELMHEQEVMTGVLEMEEVLEVVEMVLEEVMDEDEIRENLEHDYMQDLLDVEEDKRIQQEREYQEKVDEKAFQEAMEQQHMQEQMDKERERQNREEREWEERNDYYNPNNWTDDESMDVDAYNRKNTSVKFNAFTQESVTNDPSHLTQSTEEQVGDGQVIASDASDVDVAASAQDKNKGKAIQEGTNSKSAATP
ncbi:hypothetical protein Tco_0176841, partial [Tanacetum coccineum]